MNPYKDWCWACKSEWHPDDCVCSCHVVGKPKGGRMNLLEKALRERAAGMTSPDTTDWLIKRHAELLDACEAVDIYFKALCEQWAANDGRVVSDAGVVINASKDVSRLCEVAAEKVHTALANEDA